MKVLALDGGGVRCVMQLVWLEEMERRLGGPVADRFDLIAGVSASSLLACALADGLPAGEIRRRWPELAEQAFGQSARRRPGLSARGRYSLDGLRAAAEGLFGGRRIDDLPTPVLVVGYQPETCTTVLSHGREPIVDTCLASSAAPTLFDMDRPHIDGGLVAGNPSLVALGHAASRGADLRRTVLVSLGSGEVAGYARRPRHIAGVARLMMEAALRGGVRRDHLLARMLLGPRYVRLQATIPHELRAMDGARNLQALERIAAAAMTPDDDLERALALIEGGAGNHWQPQEEKIA